MCRAEIESQQRDLDSAMGDARHAAPERTSGRAAYIRRRECARVFATREPLSSRRALRISAGSASVCGDLCGSGGARVAAVTRAITTSIGQAGLCASTGSGPQALLGRAWNAHPLVRR